MQIIDYYSMRYEKLYFSDVRRAISAYPPGISRKMACCFVKTTIGPPTARRARAAVRLSRALLCWQVITNFTQNVLPVHLAGLLSGTARVTLSSSAPNYIAEYATSGRCNRSTERPTVRLPENRIASGWWKYLPAQQTQISKEESNSR